MVLVLIVSEGGVLCFGGLVHAGFCASLVLILVLMILRVWWFFDGFRFCFVFWLVDFGFAFGLDYGLDFGVIWLCLLVGWDVLTCVCFGLGCCGVLLVLCWLCLVLSSIHNATVRVWVRFVFGFGLLISVFQVV